MNSLVSIVLINYNDKKWLSAAIVSCIAQTYDHLEIIVVDDCSTDGSFEIAQGYISLSSKIKVVQTPSNGGISVARNLGIKTARGEFIALLDSDDVFLPETIENNIKLFTDIKKNHPNLIMLMSDAWLINEKGERRGRYISPKWHDKLEVKNPPLWALPSGWFFKKHVAAVFCEHYRRGGESPVFLARMKKAGTIAFCGTPNFEYRIRNRSVSNESGATIVRTMSAAVQSVKDGRLENPLLTSEVEEPSWRQVAAWTYGRNAKAAMVNRKYVTRGTNAIRIAATTPDDVIQSISEAMRLIAGGISPCSKNTLDPKLTYKGKAAFFNSLYDEVTRARDAM
jgi:cellulose synthase/poly-beta-1,6-N-acetylglucosamine synthase-like glycosyltransferase